MIIDDTNYHVGNQAMASVLLLYYHLITEDGFTHSQTVYLGPDEFNGFDFLDVRVLDDPDIDEALIREGAIIYLLCELNDVLDEFEQDYRQHHYFQRLVEALSPYRDAPIPEVGALLDLVTGPTTEAPEVEFDYPRYSEILQRIYATYVRGFWSRTLAT